MAESNGENMVGGRRSANAGSRRGASVRAHTSWCLAASIIVHAGAFSALSFVAAKSITTPPEVQFQFGADAVTVDPRGRTDGPSETGVGRESAFESGSEPDLSPMTQPLAASESVDDAGAARSNADTPSEVASTDTFVRVPELVLTGDASRVMDRTGEPDLQSATEHAESDNQVLTDAAEITFTTASPVKPSAAIRPVETLTRVQIRMVETVEVTSTTLKSAAAILVEVQRATAEARRRGAPGMLKPDQDSGDGSHASISQRVAQVDGPVSPGSRSTGGARIGVPSGIKSIRLPTPKYPLASRRAGEQGVVVLEVEVLEDGRAGNVLVDSEPGFPRLVQAAIAAVREARFEPAKVDGKPVRESVRIPFRFRLDD